MKKKLLLLFLAVISCVCLAFGFAACTGETGATGAQGEKGETGATGAAGEDGEDGVGIASVDFNEYNDFVITYTDGTTTTLGWHGTAYNPYEILPAMYSETGVFYDTFDVEADSTVYFVLEVNKTTDVYIDGVTKDDTIEGITATWDSDYGYYTATLSEGNYYIAVKNESLTAEATVELTAAIKGSYAHPYTEDDYGFDAIKAGETVYFLTGDEAMKYDVYSTFATVEVVGYESNTALTLTKETADDYYYSVTTEFAANAIIAVTNDTTATVDQYDWTFYWYRHTGAGTKTDPYMVYASDFVDEYGNYNDGFSIYYDGGYISLESGASLYFSVITGGATATLTVRNAWTYATYAVSVYINESTTAETAATDGTYSISANSRDGAALIEIKNTGTDTLARVEVAMSVKDLTVDGGDVEIIVPATSYYSYYYQVTYYNYSTVYKYFTVSAAGTYRFYYDDASADLVLTNGYTYDQLYSYDEEWDYDADGYVYTAAYKTDTTDGRYYIEFTVTADDLENNGGDIQFEISLHAYLITTEDNVTTIAKTSTEDLGLEDKVITVSIETVTATETDTSSAS